MTTPTPDPTPPRVSLISRIPAPALSGRVKKWVHASLMAALSGALSFLAFSLDSFVHLPKGAKGVVLGLAVAMVSKTSGYVLSQLPTQENPNS